MKQKKSPDTEVSLPFCFKVNDIPSEQIAENWKQIEDKINDIEGEKQNKERKSKP